MLDNSKPKHNRWLARHPNVHFHYTPTHASWLNQMECWLSILSRQALQGPRFTSVAPLREADDKFVASYSERPHPLNLNGPNGLLSRASSNIGIVT